MGQVTRLTTSGSRAENGGANYRTAAPLNADEVLAALPYVSLKHGGDVSIQCIIHNDDGTLTGVPSDNPAGVFEVWTTADGLSYSIDAAATALIAGLSPSGNANKSTIIFVPNVSGIRMKVRWNNSSGGAGNSRYTMNIVYPGDVDDALPG